MRVHVLPSKVPFKVKIKLDLIAVLWDQKYFAVRSSNLSMKKEKWSELSIKADVKDGKWRVTVTEKGFEKSFLINYSSSYIFDYLEVDIPSKTAKWYVGPKNNNCDALISTTVAPPTMPTTPSFTTRKTPTATLSNPPVTATADSDTRTTSTFSKSMPRKGKMRTCFPFLCIMEKGFLYLIKSTALSTAIPRHAFDINHRTINLFDLH